jgi:hypothetical protein
MCRFFFIGMWDVPELFPYGMIMRLDSDSTLSLVTENPFPPMLNRSFMSGASSYDNWDVVVGLWDFVESYRVCFGIVPADPEAYRIVPTLDNPPHTRVRAYPTNIWIINARRYLELPGILHFMAMVDISHGTYLYRWGDAPLYYVTLALFARPEEIVTMPESWQYRHQ